MEIIDTPRGKYKIKFSSMEQANEYNYFFWFSHNGHDIVTDGLHVCAVKKQTDDMGEGI